MGDSEVSPLRHITEFDMKMEGLSKVADDGELIRNEYLNSKEGRAKEGEEALTQENLGGGSVRA